MFVRFTYAILRLFAVFVHKQCIREWVLDGRQIQRRGGFVLAVTHLSHLEPIAISCHTRRMIHWIARVEFFQLWWMRPLLKMFGALSINRTGVPIRTIRQAIDLAKAGEVVGIFPEGGVAIKEKAMFRGGPMKRGVCVIAMRAGVPVLPVVVLGTHELNRVAPWLPAKRGRVWVAYGRPLSPPADFSRKDRRMKRMVFGEQIQAEFTRAYRHLLERSGVDEATVP